MEGILIKQYEITGVKVSFAPGFILGLTERQAQPRLQSLRKLDGNLYSVISPVEFKRGEVIGIPDGNVPKALVNALGEVAGEKKAPPAKGMPVLKHRHFGKYDVIGGDGSVLTAKPLPKEEAQAFLDRLSAKGGQ